MSNVVIDRQKIDILANAISDKSGVPVTMTLDEMVEAVDSIEAGSAEPVLQAKTYTVDSAGTETITADSGYDGLSSVAVSVPSADPFLTAYGGEYYTENNQRKWRIGSRMEVSVGEGDKEGWIADGYSKTGQYVVYNAMPSGTTITPTESAQTIGGSSYHMEGAVTVNAIPSNYVGSGITQRSSSDLTASGATVTVPSGYYASNASKSVTSGSATPASTISATGATVTTGTNALTLSKSVSNTPQVSAGYVSSGTAGNSSVSLTATVATNPTPTASGATVTIPAGYYSSQTTKSVSSGTEGTPTATKGTVSNHSISVTPSVTNSAGYITGSTINGTAVTVSASELASGNKAITQNGTDIDVVGYSTVSVDVSGAEYTRTVICPQQTVSSSSRVANLSNFNEGLVSGDYYIVTYDGTEYLCTAETLWGQAHVVGDLNLYYSVQNEYIYPFAIGSTGNDRDIAMLNTSQHTVKVEHLEFVSGGTTLTTKNITTNGTYNASSDSADGYSSVTVNVPTGTPTIQSLTVAPSTTQQSFNASGVDGYKPVTVSAVSQTNLTADNIKSGTTVTISNGTSNLWSVTGTYEGGGGSSDVATGTLTVASNVNTSASTQIATTSAIGFTPTKFFFYKTARTATSNHVHQASFITLGSYYIRTMTRYSNNALSTSGNTNSWTTQTAGYLYFNNNIIYFRSSSSYILSSGTWNWVAVK